MNVLGIIPARYASTRFPGKPLVNINGKSMIQRVYERSSQVIEDLIVATDNDIIADKVKEFDGQVILTSEKHNSGTERCAEAMIKYQELSGKDFDVIINIQGDEPFIHKEHLTKIINCFENRDTQIATLAKHITDNSDIFNPDKPKVLINNDKFAIYFSRSPIPYIRDHKKEDWHLHHKFYKHIGIYAYKKETLKKITKLEKADLEIAESLEQNRWIQNGYKIYVGLTEKESISIDTQNDLDYVKKNISEFMEN